VLIEVVVGWCCRGGLAWLGVGGGVGGGLCCGRMGGGGRWVSRGRRCLRGRRRVVGWCRFAGLTPIQYYA